jgi:pyridoxal phosphate enzyme (YggS family)
LIHKPESPDLTTNVAQIWERIREAAQRRGRDPKTVRLVAATKTVSASRMLKAYEADVRIFGENRLQEAQQKMEVIGWKPHLSWHFIGRIQRRKIKAIVGHFELIHSVENIEQAEEIERRAQLAGVQQAVLLEVNVGSESSKGGFGKPDLIEALPMLDRLRHLSIRGLMTIPPLERDAEAARPYFRELRHLADIIRESSFTQIRMDELSMGMSHDYPIAVEEGATLVRIGTAIFGARNYR